MTFTLIIPLPLPSLNTWQRMHWAMRRKIQESWNQEIWSASYIALGGHKSCKAITVIVERHGRKMMDQDNVCLKPLCDALVHCGIVPDDRPKYLTVTEVRQIQCPRGQEKTVVIITDNERGRQ